MITASHARHSQRGYGNQGNHEFGSEIVLLGWGKKKFKLSPPHPTLPHPTRTILAKFTQTLLPKVEFPLQITERLE